MKKRLVLQAKDSLVVTPFSSRASAFNVENLSYLGYFTLLTFVPLKVAGSSLPGWRLELERNIEEETHLWWRKCSNFDMALKEATVGGD